PCAFSCLSLHDALPICMKNAGATNTTVLLGWKYGFIVAFIDIFKAIISLLLAAIILDFMNVLFEMQMVFLYVNALFVVLGHNYPDRTSTRLNSSHVSIS